jgi:hypothetical protein
MKIRMMLTIFFVMAITPVVFAQTTIRLFDPIYITVSDETIFPPNEPYDFNKAISVGEKKVFLSCATGATSVISGQLPIGLNGGGFISDNYLFVNGMNICPGGPQGSCFSGTFANPYNHLGQPIENAFNPVASIDISHLMTAGINQYTFNLMDAGGMFGNTVIDITTTCTQVLDYPNTPQGYPVCHRDNGKKEQKTIYVGSQNAVQAHLNHGDTAGPCANGK